jgi:hypothetical protein
MAAIADIADIAYIAAIVDIANTGIAATLLRCCIMA